MQRHGHGACSVTSGPSSLPSNTFEDDYTDDALVDKLDVTVNDKKAVEEHNTKVAAEAPSVGVLGRVAGAAGGLAGGLWSMTTGTLSVGAQGARWVAGSGLAATTAVASRLPLIKRVVPQPACAKDKNE